MPEIEKTTTTETENMSSLSGNMTSMEKVMDVLSANGHIRMDESGRGTISMYLPKVHPSVKSKVKDLFECCNVGKVVNETYVPRLNNEDGTNSMMGFVKIIPYASPEFYMLANDLVGDKKLGYLHYMDTLRNGRPVERYLIVCINTTPEKEVEKKESGECVMDIIKKHEELIKAQSITLENQQKVISYQGEMITAMKSKLEEFEKMMRRVDEGPKKPVDWAEAE
jgi:hypothetical protein